MVPSHVRGGTSLNRQPAGVPRPGPRTSTEATRAGAALKQAPVGHRAVLSRQASGSKGALGSKGQGSWLTWVERTRAAKAMPIQDLCPGLLFNNNSNYRIAFIERLLCAEHRSKCFTQAKSFNPCNNPVRQMKKLRLSNLPQVIELGLS